MSILFQAYRDNTNMSELRTIPISIPDVKDIDQKIQFRDPYKNINEICWHNKDNCIVIIKSNTQAYLIDCLDSVWTQDDITIRCILFMIGLNLYDYEIDNVWCDSSQYFYEIIDMPIKNIPLCQFDIKKCPYVRPH